MLNSGEDPALYRYKGATLSTIVRMYLVRAPDVFEATEHLVNTMLTAVQLPNGASNVYPCLQMTTLPSFFTPALENTVNLVKHIKFDSASVEDSLYRLKKVAVRLQSLVQFTKAGVSNPSMLRTVIKQVRLFVDMLNVRMEFFQQNLEYHYDNIIQIIKTVQKSTRQVHAICTHSKNTKRNGAIAAIVPRVKRSLELFLFKAGGMIASGSTTGIQLGNLKHKDLGGKALDQPEDSSGSSSEEEDDDDGDDDDGAEEDDDTDSDSDN